ncbi:MAG: trmE [Cytophagaceae bacterium]|nr:trmE [Cytophagaceae bacterium]
MQRVITKLRNGRNTKRITMSKLISQDTIVAIATPQGQGAIGVIRLSGAETFSILKQIAPSKNWSDLTSHTVHLAHIKRNDVLLDEALIALFKNPRSYTGEDVAEISCHGSPFILQQVVQLILEKGARLAKAGEFTQRAFLRGRMDLAQAEAVADLIASETEASHRIAMHQMRGGFSNEIKELRVQLINFASLIELELDFSEEDVEFANRDQLRTLINSIRLTIERLIQSFDLGHVIKNGVPTVIVGKPNAGKSTLLNKLLHEEKAIVSDVPGTTRDLIEDEMTLDGIAFRFIDTAGLRETVDKVEAIGVQRTRDKMKQAALIIYLFDVNTTKEKELIADLQELKDIERPYLVVGNKADTSEKFTDKFKNFDGILFISAKMELGLEELKNRLLHLVNYEQLGSNQTLVTNARHYECLVNTRTALIGASKGMDEQISGDLLAQDIRQALFHLGSITGEVSADDLLGNIFSKFCIGK